MQFSKQLFIAVAIFIAALFTAIFWYASRPEVPLMPTSGQNIIAFGDSLVEGIGSSFGNDFVSVLRERLDVPIINAGRSGDTTESALARLERDVLSQDPRIVIVLLGGNDALQQADKARTFQNLRIIIDNIQDRGAAVLLLGIHGGVFQGGYKESFEKLAKEKRVFYVPKILDGIFGHASFMADEIHPNDVGYAKMADRVEPLLRKILELSVEVGEQGRPFKFVQGDPEFYRTGRTSGSSRQKLRVMEYVVEAGDTWETIMKKIGIDWSIGHAVLEASQDIHNLAFIHAGNEVRFFFDGTTDELRNVEYDMNDETLLRISQSAEGTFVVDVKDIIYDVDLTTKQGIIESSLFETAQAQRIPANIIMDLARIFAWDVDFASSVQPKDSFVVVYEDRFRDGEYAGPGKILTAKFVNTGRETYAFFYKDPEGNEEYYNEEGRELRRQFLRTPLDYKRITSGFSYNRFHPILNTFTSHRAIDYSAANGTPVSATASGVVNYAGWNDGNGKYVGIRHENGYSTGYAHLSAYAKGIRVGVKGAQNQVIGFVGSTGFSTGPHLHYEMRKNGALINPLRLDLPPGKMITEGYLEEFFIERGRLKSLL